MHFHKNRHQIKQQHNTSHSHSSIVQSRRSFLQAGLGVTTALFLPKAFANISTRTDSRSDIIQPERKLSMLNTHTGEYLDATYWAEGEYQTSEIKAINHLLRDHRTGEVCRMDNELFDLLNILHKKMDSNEAFEIISGYRSPVTNAALRQISSGVAKKSLHMEGKAIDIRLPGCELSDLRKAAIACQAGGVGYYPKSDFIHVDTGTVRCWG
jgi:uncharacterized protein YcbK (DUF882 family)